MADPHPLALGALILACRAVVAEDLADPVTIELYAALADIEPFDWTEYNLALAEKRLATAIPPGGWPPLLWLSPEEQAKLEAALRARPLTPAALGTTLDRLLVCEMCKGEGDDCPTCGLP